jgi:predicted transposase/invertase (TIGR01784 family)
MENCKPLSDYSKIVSDVRELVKQGYSMEEAIEIALRTLPEDSEVRKLIEENKAGVVDMFLTEYDEQGVMEVFREEGIEIGEESKALKIAKTMLEDGVPLDKISKYTGIHTDELNKLKQQL